LIDSVEDESRLRRISEIIFPLSHNRRTADPDDSTSIDTDTLTSFRTTAIGCARPSKAGVGHRVVVFVDIILAANLLECARLIESQRRNFADLDVGSRLSEIHPRWNTRIISRGKLIAPETRSYARGSNPRKLDPPPLVLLAHRAAAFRAFVRAFLRVLSFSLSFFNCHYSADNNKSLVDCYLKRAARKPCNFFRCHTRSPLFIESDYAL